MEPLRIAVIIGSTREGRFGPTAAAWFAGRAHRRGFDVDVVDLIDLKVTDDLAKRLTVADGFVIVTPEINRSFPASLKAAIDSCYTEWHAKPVTFVAYGRESGGRHVTDQLRLVFAELHAVAIRADIALPCYWEQFTADGAWPKPSAPCNTAVEVVLDQLNWWARALRDARIHYGKDFHDA
jgi:NAD(P)H-dependent FMN reductase